MEVTAIFEQDEGWWIARAVEVPGAFGQGRTIDECRESLTEAVELMLEEMRERAARETAGRETVHERIRIAS